MKLHEQVRDFHAAIGVERPDVPTVPSDDVVRLRLRLIAEEFLELLEASLFVRIDRSGVMGTIDTVEVRVDLPELADALADLDYVIEGTRDTFGIDGGPIAAAVHEANMAKVAEPRRYLNGKLQKPEGWRPPDIEGALKGQGWKP